MKIKDFNALQERLLPSFPGFATKGALMLFAPVAHTLRGFSFEPSSFDKKPFYVTAFFLPMYLPAKHLVFNFGHRVRKNGSDRWSADDPELEHLLTVAMQKELSFLLGLRTAKDVAKALESLAKPNQSGYINPHSLEALAYTLIWAEEITSAAKVVESILQRADRAVAWENEIAVRAQLIGVKLAKSSDAALDQLRVWESETIRNLGLESFVKP